MSSIIRCENPNCKGRGKDAKIVGALEAGRNVQFQCKACGHITVVTIDAAPIAGMPAPVSKEGQ